MDNDTQEYTVISVQENSADYRPDFAYTTASGPYAARCNVRRPGWMIVAVLAGRHVNEE